MGGKKVDGVKRHILVDTLGLVLAVVVHPANIQDRDGAKAVFAKAKLAGPWPRMARVWADGGYAGKLIKWVASFCGWILEIIKRSDDLKGFQLLPKRWVVERTFSWLSNYRRLSEHDEYWNETGEAMIYVAMIHVMLRRLARKESGHGTIQIPAPVLSRVLLPDLVGVAAPVVIVSAKAAAKRGLDDVPVRGRSQSTPSDPSCHACYSRGRLCHPLHGEGPAVGLCRQSIEKLNIPR